MSKALKFNLGGLTLLFLFYIIDIYQVSTLDMGKTISLYLLITAILEIFFIISLTCIYELRKLMIIVCSYKTLIKYEILVLLSVYLISIIKIIILYNRDISLMKQGLLVSLYFIFATAMIMLISHKDYVNKDTPIEKSSMIIVLSILILLVATYIFARKFNDNILFILIIIYSALAFLASLSYLIKARYDIKRRVKVYAISF